MWDLTPYRNEEIQTLRKLGVQIEYLILPDTEMSWSANSIIHDMLRGPLFKDGGLAGITLYLFISTCNSNVFYFFQAMMPTTMFIAEGKNTSRASGNPSLESSQFVTKKILRYKFSFFSSELFLILHISRTGFWVTVMSS